MYQNLMELEAKFEFLMNSTEAYLQPITEFLKTFVAYDYQRI